MKFASILTETPEMCHDVSMVFEFTQCQLTTLAFVSLKGDRYFDFSVMFIKFSNMFQLILLRPNPGRRLKN